MISPNDDVRLIGQTEFNMDKTNFEHFKLTSSSSKLSFMSKKCKITFECFDLHSHDISRISIDVMIRNSDIQATGDPHIMQRVFDQREKVLKMICYDITGQSGQSINILTVYMKNIRFLVNCWTIIICIQLKFSQTNKII